MIYAAFAKSNKKGSQIPKNPGTTAHTRQPGYPIFARIYPLSESKDPISYGIVRIRQYTANLCGANRYIVYMFMDNLNAIPIVNARFLIIFDDIGWIH